jgi:CDP-4-dehydro-6-deoxyglucose reductase
MAFKITLKASGHTFEVEENEFILAAALRQGISFPYGCKTGSCGTCLGQVISGDIEYPDGLPLTVMEHEHQQGKAVFCVSVAKSDLLVDIKEIESSTDIEIKILPARVASLRKLADDVMEVSLSLPASQNFTFHAGQYIEFILRDRSRRAFSIANSPSDNETIELHLRHVEGGTFTDHVFNEMKEKAILRFEGPFGSFQISESSNRPLILIAGGTGFAPIKSMIEELIGKDDTRPLHIYWGARAKADLYRNDLPEKWAFQHGNISYVPVLSEPNDDWQGRTGFVHSAVVEDFTDLSKFDIYVAGPPPMVDAAKADFIKHGLPEDQLLFDSFDFASKD